MITKNIIADKLLAYLQHHLSLADVVAWAEQALLNADYKDDSSHTIRNILAQLGTAFLFELYDKYTSRMFGNEGKKKVSKQIGR